MNFLSFFLYKILTILLISLSYEKQFNPIPKGNGKINAKYNHYRNEEDNLFFIFLTFRHGARAPNFLIDKNTDMMGGKWLSKAELTNYGRKQHYKIGLKNRDRYSNFISEDYDPKEVKIFSTNYDRTINSIQSQLLGFYSNITYTNFTFDEFNNSNNSNNDDIKYMNSIIPAIKLFEYDDESQKSKKTKYEFEYERIFKQHFDCPYISNQVRKNLNETNEIINSIMDSFNREYYDIFINEFKNINRKKLKTILGFERFCDVYISIYYDKKNYHILNKISKNGKNITKIKEICDNYLYNWFKYEENSGFAINNGIICQSQTFKKMIDWMEVRADQNNNFAAKYSEPKFVIYSGHDNMIFQLQSVLKKSFNIEFENAKFASTQLYELRKYNDIFYVEIYYDDRLKMNITFDEFKRRIENILMNRKDIYNICYKKKEELNLLHKKLFLIFILCALSIILLCIICKVYYLKNFDANSTKIIQIC